MLIIILGLGAGLENGVKSLFQGFSTNSMFLWARTTSMPYMGFTEGRRIELQYEDVDYLKSTVDGIDILAPRTSLGGHMGANNVKYKNESGAFGINGDIPEIRDVYEWMIPNGRFISDMDMQESRKVCVIGNRVVELLFKDVDPLGEYIEVQGVYFQVVGVFKTQASGERAERDEQAIIIPLTTYQKAFNGGNRVHWFSIVCKDNFSASEVEQHIQTALKQKYKIHPDDQRAFGSFNAEERFKPMQMTFITVKAISWFVGIMTLFAGVIGVSNIMLVTVKERTKEIGIRRAIGAKPWNIIIQIMAEAVILTFLAGYLGMMAGIWLVEGLGQSGLEGQMFKNPQIEIPVAVTALIVLVISGCLAGWLPAQRALQIKPVDALRAE
ncbi:MAG: ABC transporter permease [Flavobacteriales bacterium]|nr:ABC transporter permease [Bacteroidota bacterium]MCB9241982.1 ABC transporter permease [Flavobacteriales bacterium]